MEGIGGDGASVTSPLPQWGHEVWRMYQYYLDKSTPHSTYRWIGTLVVVAIYCLRVYYVQGFYIVSYGLGIYLLNLLIRFLSPLIDPELEGSDGPVLPTKGSDEFKPFIRRLPEFKFWYTMTKAFCIAFLMTFFSVFDVPVFWPILLCYWVVLFVLTMRRQIGHMIKYKYIPFNIGKQKYTGSNTSQIFYECGYHIEHPIKEKSRKATGMQVDALEEGYVDHELFSLTSIKGKKDLVAADSTEYDDGNVELRGSEDEQNREESTEYESSSDIDSDEERRRVVMVILFFLIMIRIWKRLILKQILLLDDREGPTQEEITNRWFSRDIFAEAVEQGDLGKYNSDDEMETDNKEERPAIPERSKVKKKQDEKLDIPNKAKENKENNAADPKSTKLQASKAEDDFEIVPAPATDSSDDSSSDDSEDDDVETKAEISACAKKTLRKKQRDQTLDDACNNYMFHDDGLPKWFLDEEKRHCQPIKPVTKEEIAAMPAQFKEINARSAKQFAEAKARKKWIAMKKLDKVRQKTNIILDQADISERSKWKQIEQLYKKTTPQKPQKEYVVSKKGVQVRAGKGKVFVDRQMKNDARAQGTGILGKGGSKKGKNGKARKGKGARKHDWSNLSFERYNFG